MRKLDNNGELEYFQNKTVMQHNAITSGRFDFTACQLDIIFMLLGYLQTDIFDYKIHAKDIERITGRKWNYQQFKIATEELGSRMFEIETAKSYKQLWLFQEVDYLKGEGAFTVSINEKAKPYFFDLKENFTYLQLKSVLSCSSKYAKRLYSLACQYRVKGRETYEIEDLKKMLGLIDKKGIEKYKQNGELKKFVLNIAKKQINNNTDITFDYKLYKKGRSFKTIEIFVAQKNKSDEMQIDFTRSIEEQKIAKTLEHSYGLTQEQADIIARKVKLKDIKKLIDEIREKCKQGKLEIKNAAAYLVAIYKKKGILK